MDQQKQSESLVLMSGGMDSAACIHYYLESGFHVQGLFMDYGQLAGKHERQSAAKIAQHYDVLLDEVSLATGKSFGPGEVRGRNAFFIISALMARPSFIGLLALGIHGDTLYYDCGERFAGLMRDLVTDYTDGTVQLDFPFMQTDKRGVHDYCMEHHIPLALTYSCESGTFPPCKDCPSCKDRIALGLNP